jgi:succinate-semialdehyde dehydrogenase/glutarate-semialdehyde dehydrogenase
MSLQPQTTFASQIGTFKSVNPANLQVLGEIPLMGKSQVDDAVALSWQASQAWGLTSYRQRRQLIMRLRDIIERQKDDLAALISQEVGKPMLESYLADLSGPLNMCVWLANNTEKHLAEQRIKLDNPFLSSKQHVITFEPLGVIGIISPWNFPFSIPMMTILMALMVGNTVVLKPSEKSSLVGIKIGELFQLAGFPDNVVSVVTGDRTTGEYLSKCHLAKLIFTGSVGGGAQVMSQASSVPTPVCLELGGKDAAIVFPDAPPEWTAKGLTWGAFTNAGQACASIERVYLIKGKNTEKLIEEIVAKTKSLRVGPAWNEQSEIGPLIDEFQFNVVANQVDNAVKNGAKILCGGKRVEGLNGYFYEPTVLLDVNHAMRIMNEETFGPVLPIMIVASEAEALQLANQSDFGLTASIWTKDLKKAKTLATELKTGTVYINDCLFSHAMPELPWGGLRKSGFGRSHSHFGFLDLVNIKYIAVDKAGGAHRLWWYPYGKSRGKQMRGGLASFHASFPFGRLKGLYSFISNMSGKG